MENISVIPEIIDKSSVSVNGSWKAFSIRWKPVENVNFGTVFYEVIINTELNNETRVNKHGMLMYICWLLKSEFQVVTTNTVVKYQQKTTPFTKLRVSIRAFTYWGASPQIQTEVHSPSSTPSAPRNLRAFITYDKFHRNINITFRWDPPIHSNGVIQGYSIFCWHHENETVVEGCQNIIVRPTQRQYIVQNLLAKESYKFQVSICFNRDTNYLSRLLPYS